MLQSQAHITSFFLPQTIGEPKKVKSKRVMQTLTRMRATKRETQEERKNETKPSTTEHSSENIEETKITNNYSSLGNRNTTVMRRKVQTSRGKGKVKGRGRGKASGSIPLVPTELMQTARGRGRDGREYHLVVLSESSSSSESDDEKPRQSGGFL